MAEKKTTAKKATKATPKKEVKKAAPKKEVKEEVKKETPKKSNKKLFIILGIVAGAIIVFIILMIALIAFAKSIYHRIENAPQTIEVHGTKLKIREAEAKAVKYDKYDNGLVSFNYPKGWKVDVAKTDYIHYSFKVYNPKDPSYMFYFGLKLEGFLKSEKARSTYAKYYPDAPFSKLPAIDPQNAEAFYKVWNSAASYVNASNGDSYMPRLDNFTVIEKLGKGMLDGDLLRASYTKDGKKVQGLFTASVMSIGTYYINTDIFNVFSEKVDVSPLNVYNTVFLSAPDTEFNDWHPVLEKCLNTIMFSQKFVDEFNKEETQITSTIVANQKVYDSISDGIMDSWEKRNNSYDIISQKQSDATLGYERVYDTETGDVYKAYNGFTDDYDGNRYKPISDNQYTETISGYIEK